VSVRITQGMLNRNMLNNLNRSYHVLDKYQNQLSSGKKINKPSDDPVSSYQAMFHRTNVFEIDQFKRNASDGLSWTEATDDALDQVTNVLHRVRELVVKASNGTNEGTSISAIKEELEQLKEHIGEIANTTIGGKYIFSGTATQTKPYDKTDQAIKDDINAEKIKFEVAQDSFITVNINGQKLFKGVLEEVQQVIGLLEANENPEMRLEEIDVQLNDVLKERARVGANTNRIELMLAKLDSAELTAKKLLSNTEDADIAEVITELITQENVHRAALSAGARIIQLTLVDFLR